MNATTHSKTVTILSDVLRVSYDGNMWVSPHNGQQHSRSADAMRSELEAYFQSCGDDIENEEIADQIDGLLSQMVDA